jgi:hypothetical protein
VATVGGALWKVTVEGLGTVFEAPSAFLGICTGPDGSLWVADESGNVVAFPFTVKMGDLALTSGSLLQTAALLTVAPQCICPINGVMPPSGVGDAALVGVCTQVPKLYAPGDALTNVGGPLYGISGLPPTPDTDYITLVAGIVIADLTGANSATWFPTVTEIIPMRSLPNPLGELDGNVTDGGDSFTANGDDLTFDAENNCIRTTSGGMYVVQAGWALGWDNPNP